MHTPLRLALAAALFALSAVVVSAQSGDNLIVPRQRIGPVTIGIDAGELYRRMGNPVSSDSYCYYFASLAACMSPATNRVANVSARDTKYTTREGIRIGSPLLEVRAKLGPPTRSYHQGMQLCYAQGLYILPDNNGFVKSISVSSAPTCEAESN
jgi:hypothetical protein